MRGNKIITVTVLFFMSCAVNAQVSMQQTDGGLLFTEKNKEILFYRSEPKSQEGKYQRCNYIHPLWADDGTALTEDFPIDHLYHRGIFWAWRRILINGQQISDGWEIKNFDLVCGAISLLGFF